jgi:tyrosine-protein kinase Fer
VFINEGAVILKNQMGFSSNLQSRAAHEALLCRQDAELRLLDTMRRCLATRVKCDREYAVALQGQKLERAEDLVGSLVAQAWENMLEELENTAKLIKQNADLVESKSLDKLNSLYAEKRRARKHYQEEHNRIVAEFTHVHSWEQVGASGVAVLGSRIHWAVK